MTISNAIRNTSATQTRVVTKLVEENTTGLITTFNTGLVPPITVTKESGHADIVFAALGNKVTVSVTNPLAIGASISAITRATQTDGAGVIVPVTLTGIADGGTEVEFSPSVLFSNNELGAWYDFTDMDRLWTDTAGTSSITGAGQKVARIDRSAGTHDPLVQSSTTQRPTYTSDGFAYFDATDDNLATVLNQSMAGTDEVSVAVALNFKSSTNNPHILTHGGDLSGTYSLRRGAAAEESFLFSVRGSLSPQPAATSSYPGSQSVVLIARGKILTNVAELFVNGVLVASSTSNQGTGGFSIRPTTIGRLFGAGLDADVAGIVVVNRLITNTEVANLDTFLRNKIGPIPVPNINLSNVSVTENVVIGDTVGLLSTTGGTGAYTLSITSDPDNKFDISGSALITTALFDYETAQSHSVTVEGINALGEVISETFNITVSNIFENPTLGTLSLSSVTATQGVNTTINILGATAGSTITGAVPDGMVLNSSLRTIVGIPTVVGMYNFALTETLSDSPNSPISNDISIDVVSAGATGTVTLSNPQVDVTGSFVLFNVSGGTWNDPAGIIVDPTKVTITAQAPSVDVNGVTNTTTVIVPCGLRAEYIGGSLCLWVEGGIYADYTSVNVEMAVGAIMSGPDVSLLLESTPVTNNNVLFTIPPATGHIIGIAESRTSINVPFGVVRGNWRAEATGMHSSGIAGVEWTITKQGQSAVVSWQNEERRSWYQDTNVISDTQWTANANSTLEGGLGVWPSPSGNAVTDPTGEVTITALIVPKVGGRSRARSITRTIYSAQAGTYPERHVWLDTVNGSDSNDGLSIGSPKLTMTAAANTAGSVNGGATQTTVPVVNIIGGTAQSPRTVEISLPATGATNTIPSSTDTYLRLQPAAGYTKDDIYIVNHAGAVGGVSHRVRRLAFHNLTIDMSDSPTGSSSKALLSANTTVYPNTGSSPNPQHYWFHKCKHTHRQGKIGQFSEGGSGNFLSTSHNKLNLSYWTDWEHSNSGQRGIQSNTRIIMRNIRIVNIQKDVFKQPDCVFGFYSEDNAVDPRLLPVTSITGTITAGDVVTGVYSWPSSATVESVPATGMVRLTPGGNSYQFKSDDSKTHVAITISGEVGTITVGEEISNAGNTVRFRVYRRDGNILRGAFTLGTSLANATTVTGLTSGGVATVASSATGQKNLFFSTSGATATASPPHPDGLQIQAFRNVRLYLNNTSGTFTVGETVGITGIATAMTIVAVTGSYIDISGSMVIEFRTSDSVVGNNSGATGTITIAHSIDNDTNMVMANGYMRRMDGQLLFGENGSANVSIWNVVALKLDVESNLVCQFANIPGITIAHCTIPTSTIRLPTVTSRFKINGTPPGGQTYVQNIFRLATSDYIQNGLSASASNRGRPGVRFNNHLTQPTGQESITSQRTADLYVTKGNPSFVNGINWDESDTSSTLSKNSFRPTATVPTNTTSTPANRLAKYDVLGIERLAADWYGAVSSRT